MKTNLGQLFYSVLLFPADGGRVCSAEGGAGVRDGPAAEGEGAPGPTSGKTSQHREDEPKREVTGIKPI